MKRRKRRKSRGREWRTPFKIQSLIITSFTALVGPLLRKSVTKDEDEEEEKKERCGGRQGRGRRGRDGAQ